MYSVCVIIYANKDYYYFYYYYYKDRLGNADNKSMFRLPWTLRKALF